MQAPNGQFVQSQEIDSIVGSPIFLEQFAGVALMDVDGDGLPEIVVPEYKVGDAVTSGLRIFKRDLAGQFHAVAFMSTRSLARMPPKHAVCSKRRSSSTLRRPIRIRS